MMEIGAGMAYAGFIVALYRGWRSRIMGFMESVLRATVAAVLLAAILQ